MTDEHGMPLPNEAMSPLPWKVERDEMITDRCGCKVEADCDGFPETLHFIAHSANWIVPCREIVRRMADGGTIGDKALMYELWEDTARLWAKMKKEVGNDT